MNPETASSLDLRSTISIVRHRKWIVAIVTVLTVGVAIAVSLSATPIYESSSEVQVNPLDPNQVMSGYGYAFLYSMPNEVTIAESPQVADGAAKIVEAHGGNPQSDTGSVSVTNPADTSSLVFTYSDPVPANAQQWAQAYADSYIADRQGRAEAAYTASSSNLESTIGKLRDQMARRQADLASATAAQKPSIQSEINSLIGQIASLETRLSTIPLPYADATRLVVPAQLPSTPSSPKPLRNAVLALILGLGLGFAAALLRERLDDRTAGKADLESAIGAPVLGVVPKVEGWRKRSNTQLITRDAPKSAAAEAYRSLRTNLQFLAQTENLRVLAVTSANLGEGKTTTVANLGVTLAQTGARVLLVSADLRKPRLHRFFGAENITGLSDVLDGYVSLVTAAQKTGVDSLRLVASGPVPTNPAELLGSSRFTRLIEDLSRVADFVLIDTPPALAVADALSIARVTDGIIVVADASNTTLTALRHVRQNLEQVGAKIVGGIYNSYDPSRASDGGKYYGYGYSGYEERQRSNDVDPTSIPIEGRPDSETIWD